MLLDVGAVNLLHVPDAAGDTPIALAMRNIVYLVHREAAKNMDFGPQSDQKYNIIWEQHRKYNMVPKQKSLAEANAGNTSASHDVGRPPSCGDSSCGLLVFAASCVRLYFCFCPTLNFRFCHILYFCPLVFINFPVLVSVIAILSIYPVYPEASSLTILKTWQTKPATQALPAPFWRFPQPPKPNLPKQKISNERSQAKGSQAKDPKRKIPTEIIPSERIPSEGSQSKDPKRRIPIEGSQAQVPNLNSLSRRSS